VVQIPLTKFMGSVVVTESPPNCFLVTHSFLQQISSKLVDDFYYRANRQTNKSKNINLLGGGKKC